jgi:predicted transcriptional regulator
MLKAYSRKLDTRPKWGIEVEKILLERKMTKKKLAENIGISKAYLYNVLRGEYSEHNVLSTKKKIFEYLGIEVTENAEQKP